MRLDVLLVGVGGQGILTSAAILARAAMNSGINVLTAETHGMAQRGGSVEVHVRFGDVKSPLIPYGSADVMVALEPVEALRYTHYCSEKTVAIVNTKPIIPLSVSRGDAEYPSLDTISEKLSYLKSVHFINATELAEEAGSPQATNVVVLGALSKITSLNYDAVEKALIETLPPKLHEVNLKALKAGYDALKA
ncbi:indolepyruvate ferredoxin oxidoreductase subunit beta [Archaeoglobus veneficus]|uniref:Indolepyruvate ferredoxin oxidoreductase subunit beta n=1 Tax=Archaeoglobus veneficus (strain DSM 11195 / SNP6) TaxID=693661 RepID=F2KTD0_ARCVS|nr:indolepyruvate ferredoxin oxidoreductase subunit beta [Archaeoglobus veneficus]AEA47160.1 indolepyruvate ferredoxin oxidoreductase, beta subunit [Archaeoglobus veneficus SNP6]